MLYFVLFFTVLSIRRIQGDEFFESVNARLVCYKEEQTGCNTPINEAYPEYGRSHNNLTRATTKLYLFTHDNVDDPELLHLCAGDTPPNSKFNPKCRTEIFLPGFVSGVCNYAIYRELKDERLKCGCYNVILVDWMWGNIFDLIEAKLNMRIVAKHVVIMMQTLMAKYNLTGADFILTGHSYGAHMAALVSQEERVGIINGIDPSGVVYAESDPLDDRLDPDDADCVYVSNCNAGQCLPKYFGANFTTGSVEFFYNDGLFQPACYPQMLKSFLKHDYFYATLHLLYPACSHFQCLQYYKASMCPQEDCIQTGVGCNSYEEFKSGMCRDCGPNGENCAVAGAYACDCLAEKPQNYKKYYLETTLLCPFCDNSKINDAGYSCSAANPPRVTSDLQLQISTF